MRLTVDGEVFTVQERPGDPGVYDLSWETGRVPGYGFTMANNHRTAISEEDLTDAIRDFLAEIDPVTGYLE